jgi:hypothetical protein
MLHSCISLLKWQATKAELLGEFEDNTWTAFQRDTYKQLDLHPPDVEQSRQR